MIKLIPYLDAPELIQESLDNYYQRGYTLDRIRYGFYFFKRSNTPQVNLYITQKTKLHYAHVIKQESFSKPELTITYAQGLKQDLSKLDKDSLAAYYHFQKTNYLKQTNFLYTIPVLIFMILVIAKVSYAILGWTLIVLLFTLLHRYLNYRRFMKHVYKPLASNTDIVPLKGILTFVLVSDRKLSAEESEQLEELGKLEFSNKKEDYYVYFIKTLNKHIDIKKKIDSFNLFDYKLYRANRSL